MSWSYEGPYPIDLGAISASVRRALEDAEARMGGTGRRDGPATAPNDRGPRPTAEGMYLLWRPGAPPSLAGFWFVFGASYLDQGVDGPPDTAPPYVDGLLTALTEAVWWEYLVPVRPARWSPVVVMEWPPALASRATLAPPGVPSTERDGNHDLGSGNWLPLGATEAVSRSGGGRGGEDPWAHLPKERSLLCVVRATVEKEGKLARGRWTLVDPLELAPATATQPAPLEDWLAAAQRPVVSRDEAPIQDPARQHRHHLGGPLALPESRVGFASSGWLTRGLATWPATPGDLTVGALRDRDVGARWKAQVQQVLASTLGVVFVTLSVALVVYALSRPAEGEAEEGVLPQPQPALSVCSPSDAQFINELRCQVEVLAAGGAADAAACADKASIAEVPATPGDLQAAWCGLRDRDQDAWVAVIRSGDKSKEVPWADLAAARACFNVLGKPYRYGFNLDPSATASTGRVADPELLLLDEALKIQGLVSVVAELDQTCDQLRPRLLRQTQGAILASHVGEPTPLGVQAADGPRALRTLVAGAAMGGMSQSESACFAHGMQYGVLEGWAEGAGPGNSPPMRYADLCRRATPPVDRLERPPVADPAAAGQMASQLAGASGAPAPSDDFEATRMSWAKLGGAVPADGPPLVTRYMEARFSLGRKIPAEGDGPTWACHADLATGIPGATQVALGAWEVPVGQPSTYRLRTGSVSQQLAFDAALQQIDAAPGSLGGCWGIVKDLTLTYPRVHPLLGPPEQPWPSVEQQVCGQACAAAYHLRPLPEGATWVTPLEDLRLCLDGGAPRGDEGLRRLDRLQLPWNPKQGGGWQPARASELCAFHVLAQGYLPPAVVVGEVPSQLWAGTGERNSQLAGGPDGTAQRAALALNSVGKARSINSCGHVAAQCFVSGMLDVMGQDRLRAYEWAQAWDRDVVALVNPDKRTEASSRQSVMQTSPWCGLVQPFVSRDGRLPEGQLDYPCAYGVEETRTQVFNSIRAIASGRVAETAP